MAKVSANYEVVYIIDPAQGEEAVAATVEKFKTLAEQNATAVEVEEWGKRRLAYAINYKTEGPHVLHQRARLPQRAGPCLRDYRWYPAFHDRLQGPVRGGTLCRSTASSSWAA